MSKPLKPTHRKSTERECVKTTVLACLVQSLGRPKKREKIKCGPALKSTFHLLCFVIIYVYFIRDFCTELYGLLALILEFLSERKF